MSTIHPTAIIDPKAQLASDVTIGPYAIVEANTFIDAGTTIGSHAVIRPYTRIGQHVSIGHHTVMGGPPQDLSYQPGTPHWLEIHDHANIREFTSIHGAVGENNATRIGAHCFVMANVHLGHNVELDEHVIIASATAIAGYVTIGQRAFIGGVTGIHQFVRIGALAMVGGCSRVAQDIAPFAMSNGVPAHVTGLNVVGMRRAGLSVTERARVKRVFQHLFYSSQQNFHMACDSLATTFSAEELADPHVQTLLRFVTSESKRGHTRTTTKIGTRATDAKPEEADNTTPVNPMLVNSMHMDRPPAFV